jgi:hypothetical protein
MSNLVEESPAAAAWKQLDTVRETVRTLTELSAEERKALERMIAPGNSTLLNELELSSSMEDLTARLIRLARTTESAMELDDEKEPDVAAAGAGEEENQAEQALTTALNRMAEDKKRSVAQSSVKNLIKILSKLKKKPNDAKARKIKITKNILFTKFIAGVQGAEDFLHAIGYRRVAEGKRQIESMVIEPSAINPATLSRAIELLQERAGNLASHRAVQATGPRVRCKGGCGFFGDPQTENLCSQCYKKTYLVEKKNTSDAKTASSQAAPVVRVPCEGPGCRFFGTTATNNMCSSCYRTFQEANPDPWQDNMRNALLKLKAVRHLRENIMPKQTKKNRCWTCHKRVGITGIECRCRYIFCGKHRYADMHNCQFDHKKQQRRKLEKQLERVAHDKFERVEDA